MGFPKAITCMRPFPEGFSKMGFISAWGATPAARACTAWARPISAPSGVTQELLDMFWDLKGATFSPRRDRLRHRAAATVLLPAWDEVPSTMMARARECDDMGEI